MRRLTVGLSLLLVAIGACPTATGDFFSSGGAGGRSSTGGTGADTLAFSVQPTNATAANVITPAIQVSVLDSLHQPDAAFTTGVTIALGQNPSGATLSGTLTVTPVNGVASFGDLKLDRTGSGYTLTASTAGAVGTTSASFNITP